MSAERIYAELRREEAELLERELCEKSYSVTGKGVFKEEFVTCGGARRSEINWRTMESKLVPGLYFAGEVIDVDDLRDIVRLEAKTTGGDNEKERPGTLREFKESAERTFLVGKLRENNWNISKTAEVIGTPRSNLYKKLEQYGISQEGDG